MCYLRLHRGGIEVHRGAETGGPQRLRTARVERARVERTRAEEGEDESKDEGEGETRGIREDGW